MTQAFRQFPFPYRHVVTFDSDVDRQEPWHGAAIHRLLNERLGLHISDSCWVMAARARKSSFFMGADLNVRPVPEEENHIAWRLLLREWHRGNIDHFHSWYDDGTYLLRYPQSGGDVVVPPPPASVGGAVYRVLRLLLPSNESRDALSSLVLETDDGEQLTYALTSENRTTRLVGEAGRVTPTIELILGMDRPVSGNAPRNWTAIRRMQADRGDVEAVELDNMSRRLLMAQATMMERLNIRPVYVSSHGGRTSAQNFGERQVETHGRFDSHACAVVGERVPQADKLRSHAYHADLLAGIGVEVIWPQTWETWRQYTHFQNENPPSLQEWQGTLFLGAWRTKINVSMGQLASASVFGAAIAAHLSEGSKAEFSRIYTECHSESGLAGKVVPGHGAMLPLLLAVSLSAIRNDRTADHIWYTHFGSHRDNRLDEITPEQPFTPFCTDYWRKLAAHVHGLGAAGSARVWAPAAGTYFRYKMATQYLRDAIRVDGSRVSITPCRVAATDRLLPDLRAGTRDLHGLSIYVDDAHAASLTVDGLEIHSFSRNPEDETGRPSITILDDHCPTPLLDRIPAAEIGRVEKADCDFVDLEGPGAGYFCLSATGPEPALCLAPYSLHLWNTNHFALRFRMHGPGSLKVTLEMADRAPIHIVATPPDGSDDAAYWLYRPTSGWQEHWLPVASLYQPRLQNTQDPPAVPVGQVVAIQLELQNASRATMLELDWLQAFRACPDAIAPDDHLIMGGRVLGPDGPVRRARISARDGAGQEYTAITDRYGYWLIDDTPRNTLLELRCLYSGRSKASRAGRYVDLRKDEVELDFMIDTG